jgi:(1->4)-alpha-D-glucan 1-alpha-D-glucosylmutase
MMMNRHMPQSTYRLQLHKDFAFDEASAIAPYLYELGISHAYSSPYLQASPGSTHGYDVVDHQRVNEELGGMDAHERFSKRLGENGLGQILDIVPNHMAVGSENRLWWDVLENGASSRYASFFDIDWQPQEERLRDKVITGGCWRPVGLVWRALERASWSVRPIKSFQSRLHRCLSSWRGLLSTRTPMP